jgi:hypothetical protein
MPRRAHDPIARLYEQIAASRTHYCASIVGDRNGLTVVVAHRKSGACTRWQWAWTRDTRDEDEACRQALAFLVEDGIITLAATAPRPTA